MEQVTQFYQGVISTAAGTPAQGYCFSVAVKWLGLMLKDHDQLHNAATYLTRTGPKKIDPNGGGRMWRGTIQFQQESELEAAKDAKRTGREQLGPVKSQEISVRAWLKKHHLANVSLCAIDLDELTEDEDTTPTLMGLLKTNASHACLTRGILVSSTDPPHTIAFHRCPFHYEWYMFDPNYGVYKINSVEFKDFYHANEDGRHFMPGWVFALT